MKSHRPAFLLLVAVSISASAGNWEFSYQPASVSYATYGNTLGDPAAPSKGDKRIAFEIRGTAAREMFEAMETDQKDMCNETSGTRFRSRDNEKLICNRSKEGKYTCYFGFDLKSGKSIGGSIC